MKREFVASLLSSSCLCVFVFVSVLVLNCNPAKPVLPAKGVAFTDSLYGSAVVRITDKDVDHYSGSGIENEYAKADAWSGDGKYLILRGNDGIHYLYNGQTFQLIRSLDALSGGQELEPRWDATDAGVFCYLAGPALMNFNVATQVTDTIHDFRREFPACAYVTTGVEGDASRDQRYWCFMLQDSLTSLFAVCVFDRAPGSVVGQKTSFPDAVNFSTMDASGNHAVLCYDSIPMQAFHRDFSHEVDFVAGATGHSDVALTSDGRDVMVYQNNATDSISMTDLETGAQTGLLPIPFDTNPDIGLHVSGNCYAVPGWVMISTNGALNPPGGRHSWMDELLFMLELKTSPRVVKLARTHCYTGSSPRENYFAEAFASVNTAGTKVVYGSNWGILSPADYTDAYQVTLPANWNQGGADVARKSITKFQQERERLNKLVMNYAGRGIKRFYSIDAQVYEDGALPGKTKELLGLVASTVLRCDDCIKYHLINCREHGVTTQEFDEALAIAMVVGGSITIPHIRRAFGAWDELTKTTGKRR
jgi:AhpD family alkylhydroperoxidase